MGFFYIFENGKGVRHENEEFKPETTLNELVEGGKIFTRKEFHEILNQAFSILDEMRCVFPPVLHNAINPSNILLDKNNNMTLINFNKGTNNKIFLAPEDELVTPKTDLYSMGVSMLKLLGLNPSEIKKNKDNEFILDELEIDENDKKLLKKMIAINPNDRFRDMKEAKSILSKVMKNEISDKDWIYDPVPIIQATDEHTYYETMEDKYDEQKRRNESYMKFAIFGSVIILILLYLIINKI